MLLTLFFIKWIVSDFMRSVYCSDLGSKKQLGELAKFGRNLETQRLLGDNDVVRFYERAKRGVVHRHKFHKSFKESNQNDRYESAFEPSYSSNQESNGFSYNNGLSPEAADQGIEPDNLYYGEQPRQVDVMYKQDFRPSNMKQTWSEYVVTNNPAEPHLIEPIRSQYRLDSGQESAEPGYRPVYRPLENEVVQRPKTNDVSRQGLYRADLFRKPQMPYNKPVEGQGDSIGINLGQEVISQKVYQSEPMPPVYQPPVNPYPVQLQTMQQGNRYGQDVPTAPPDKPNYSNVRNVSTDVRNPHMMKPFPYPNRVVAPPVKYVPEVNNHYTNFVGSNYGPTPCSNHAPVYGPFQGNPHNANRQEYPLAKEISSTLRSVELESVELEPANEKNDVNKEWQQEEKTDNVQEGAYYAPAVTSEFPISPMPDASNMNDGSSHCKNHMVGQPCMEERDSKTAKVPIKGNSLGASIRKMFIGKKEPRKEPYTLTPERNATAIDIDSELSQVPVPRMKNEHGGQHSLQRSATANRKHPYERRVHHQEESKENANYGSNYRRHDEPTLDEQSYDDFRDRRHATKMQEATTQDAVADETGTAAESDESLNVDDGYDDYSGHDEGMQDLQDDDYEESDDNADTYSHLDGQASKEKVNTPYRRDDSIISKKKRKTHQSNVNGD